MVVISLKRRKERHKANIGRKGINKKRRIIRKKEKECKKYGEWQRITRLNTSDGKCEGYRSFTSSK